MYFPILERNTSKRENPSPKEPSRWLWVRILHWQKVGTWISYNWNVSPQGYIEYLYCAGFVCLCACVKERPHVTLTLLTHVSVVGQMRPKVKCNTDNTQTSWPLSWKLHFSSINEVLLLYWLMAHFCSEGQKSMYATRRGAEEWCLWYLCFWTPPALTHK